MRGEGRVTGKGKGKGVGCWFKTRKCIFFAGQSNFSVGGVCLLYWQWLSLKLKKSLFHHLRLRLMRFARAECVLEEIQKMESVVGGGKVKSVVNFFCTVMT